MTVVLLDDHPVVRLGVRALLTSALPRARIVAEADTPAAALDALRTHRPTIVIADLELPDASGLDLLPAALAASPLTRIVVLTVHESAWHAAMAFAAGATAYVVKAAAPRDLADAVTAAAAGRPFLSRPLSWRDVHAIAAGRVPPLSPREAEAVSLRASGLTYREIATRMGVAPRTVDALLARASTKAGLPRRALPSKLSLLRRG